MGCQRGNNGGFDLFPTQGRVSDGAYGTSSRSLPPRVINSVSQCFNSVDSCRRVPGWITCTRAGFPSAVIFLPWMQEPGTRITSRSFSPDAIIKNVLSSLPCCKAFETFAFLDGFASVYVNGGSQGPWPWQNAI